MAESPRDGSGCARWLLPLLAFLVAVALSAGLAWLLFTTLRGEDAPAPAAPPDPGPTAGASATATSEATPSATATPAAATAPATAPATPSASAPTLASPSPTASPPPAASPEATPTATLDPGRDYADLVVSDAYARDNRLFVVVGNRGAADADGAIEVSVDGGAAQRIDTGKALRPGDVLERPIEGEYVQRRSQVVVTLRASASIVESNVGNNVYVGIVEPDVPNDLELVTVEYGGSGPHLIATIRNGSPIPIRGGITIGIRDLASGGRLLLRAERSLEVESGETQSFEFPSITSAPPETLQVIISTDAINDADGANNSLPRFGSR